MATVEEMHAIRTAFSQAQSRRPYKIDTRLIEAATPPGGEWSCVAGAVCRLIKWGNVEVAYVNPMGQLDDSTEADIAMAMRALPTMDAALRAIIVLAEKADNLDAIRALATSVTGYIEMPAPRIQQPDEDEGDDPNGEDVDDRNFPFSGSF